MSCAISPDCDHLSSSDNVIAWSGVQWNDVTYGVTILCNSRTFAPRGREGMTCCMLPLMLKQGHRYPFWTHFTACARV